MATDGCWRVHPEVAARHPAEASSVRASVMRWFPVESSASRGSRLGVAVHAVGGTFRDRRRRLTEVSFERALARCGSLAFPADRLDLGCAVSSSAGLHGSPRQRDRRVPSLNRPLLAFAFCVDSVVTSPTRRPPKGSSVRVHARPLFVRRRQGGRAIPAARHPKKPCSRRSSRRAGASFPAPEGAGPSPTRGPAGGVPGASTLPSCRSKGRGRWSRASSTHRAPLVRRGLGPPKEVAFPDRGRVGQAASGLPR